MTGFHHSAKKQKRINRKDKKGKTLKFYAKQISSLSYWSHIMLILNCDCMVEKLCLAEEHIRDILIACYSSTLVAYGESDMTLCL